MNPLDYLFEFILVVLFGYGLLQFWLKFVKINHIDDDKFKLVERYVILEQWRNKC
jgi:hypothetical protein